MKKARGEGGCNLRKSLFTFARKDGKDSISPCVVKSTHSPQAK